MLVTHMLHEQRCVRVRPRRRRWPQKWTCPPCSFKSTKREGLICVMRLCKTDSQRETTAEQRGKTKNITGPSFLGLHPLLSSNTIYNDVKLQGLLWSEIHPFLIAESRINPPNLQCDVEAWRLIIVISAQFCCVWLRTIRVVCSHMTSGKPWRVTICPMRRKPS